MGKKYPLTREDLPKEVWVSYAGTYLEVHKTQDEANRSGVDKSLYGYYYSGAARYVMAGEETDGDAGERMRAAETEAAAARLAAAHAKDRTRMWESLLSQIRDAKTEARREELLQYTFGFLHD